MEHFGDDFLTALADSLEDTEDWEQAVELEACGTLADILDKNYEAENDGNTPCYILEDSPEGKGRMNPVLLDSSSDSEDMDFGKPSKSNTPLTPAFGMNTRPSSSAFGRDRSDEGVASSSHRHQPRSTVVAFLLAVCKKSNIDLYNMVTCILCCDNTALDSVDCLYLGYCTHLELNVIHELC